MPSFNETIKPAAILGNGPSLKDFDFQNNLRDYATFGMNAAYRFWDRINWYPDYYSCLDTVVGLSHKDEIRRLIERADEYGIRGFLLRDNLIKELGPAGLSPKVSNFDYSYLALIGSPYVTTGSHTLAWAAFLGYRDIVLLGIDANYLEILSEAKRKEGITLELTKTPGVNPNYFFDDYQRQGDLYQIPNPNPEKAIHICSWQNLKVLRRHGVCVVNANPDSKVDAFPKCRFDEVEAVLKQERVLIPHGVFEDYYNGLKQPALSELKKKLKKAKWTLKKYKFSQLLTFGAINFFHYKENKYRNKIMQIEDEIRRIEKIH